MRLNPQLSSEAIIADAATRPTAPVPVFGNAASARISRCAGAEVATT
jgi:hypothetical protein